MKVKRIVGICVIIIHTLMFVYVGFDSYGLKILEVFPLDLIVSVVIIVVGARVKETKVSFFALLLLMIPRIFYIISIIIVFKDTYLIVVILYFSYTVLSVLLSFYLWKKEKELSITVMGVFVLGISILLGINVLSLSFRLFITGELSEANYINSEYSFLFFMPALLYLFRNNKFKLKLLVFGIFMIIQSFVIAMLLQTNSFSMNLNFLQIVCINVVYIILFTTQFFILKRISVRANQKTG